MAKYVTGHPIFQKYSLDDLAKRLNRSEQTLLWFKNGHKPIGGQFRHMAAAILNQPIDSLFLEGNESEPEPA